ncbi:MAG: hypothetical protein LBU81_07255 [Methanosarcinales archaeon]|jgi:predicted nucleic acid-binding protein|nr:hypothetical protein [Methanosarcinales archaeon]
MTDIYFDTDCLSSFLWIRKQKLLVSHFRNIKISDEVYSELCNPTVPHLKKRTDQLLKSNNLKRETLMVGTPEWQLYLEMTRGKDMKIGKGEAATIALAKCSNGITASNNLKDICYYIKKYQLINKTTACILRDMYIQGIINEITGNIIWNDLMMKRPKSIPRNILTFSDYIKATPTKC